VNRQQKRTLARIFEQPTRADVRWADLASLLRSIGAQEHQGQGSRVRFVLDDSILNLHKPHPGSEMRRYAVEDVREWLAALGITPEN
jgi:hypothetical protein